MTAFGNASVETEIGTIAVELQSYNRKHLEVRVQSPSECGSFTIPLQRRVGERVGRGAVTVRIDIEYREETPFTVTPNLPMARQYQKAVAEIEGELGLDDSGLLKSLLARSPEVFQIKGKGMDDELLLNSLLKALDKALTAFLEMREFEGEKLKQDLLQRLETLRRGVSEIATLSEGSVELEKEKLKELFQGLELLEGEKEAALLREITLFAQRIDIQEELTRFESHLDHFLSSLKKGDNVGKTLDFLAQELMRETNTIGSKSQRKEIARLVVEMKSEIERIREQVQNIE
jgi:uncharacterized protein (TIGR00255 family)